MHCCSLQGAHAVSLLLPCVLWRVDRRALRTRCFGRGFHLFFLGMSPLDMLGR